MRTDECFYLEQAALNAEAARTASLSNERNKFLQAEKAWIALATRIQDLRDGRASLHVKPALTK